MNIITIDKLYEIVEPYLDQMVFAMHSKMFFRFYIDVNELALIVYKYDFSDEDYADENMLEIFSAGNIKCTCDRCVTGMFTSSEADCDHVWSLILDRLSQEQRMVGAICLE